MEELDLIFRLLGYVVPPEEIVAAARNVDPDGDGQITLRYVCGVSCAVCVCVRC